MLDEDQVHCPNYVAVPGMAINSTINASSKKELFEVLNSENIPLAVYLLLSRESSINSQACIFTSKTKQLANKVKSAMHDD